MAAKKHCRKGTWVPILHMGTPGDLTVIPQTSDQPFSIHGSWEDTSDLNISTAQSLHAQGDLFCLLGSHNKSTTTHLLFNLA